MSQSRKKIFLVSATLVFLIGSFFVSSIALAAAPGGVAGGQLWIKADGNVYTTGTTQATNGQTIETWENLFGDDAIQTALARKPKFNTVSLINGHSTVFFDGAAGGAYPAAADTGDRLEISTGLMGAGNVINQIYSFNVAIPATPPSAFYSVLNFESALAGNPSGQTAGSEATARRFVNTLYVDRYGNDMGSHILSPTQRLYTTPFPSSSTDANTTTPYIWTTEASVGGTVADSPNERAILRNGRVLASDNGFITTLVGQGNPYIVGSTIRPNISGAHEFPFSGRLAESIVYYGNLTAGQVNQVQSYLACKYGITLDQTTPQNYTSSTGSTTWSAVTNAGYGQNITCIGTDSATELLQTSSRSVNTQGLITLSNATGQSEGDFLVAGDNGASVATFAIAGSPNGYQRIAREWKAQQTGSIGNVNVAVDVNNVNANIPTFTGSLYLIADTNNNGVIGLGDIPVLMTNTFGSTWTASGVNIPNGRLFTFGSITIPAPSITSTNPASPSNNAAPLWIGTADPSATTVTLYSDNLCTTSVASGTRASFISTGISGAVTPNTVNTYYASASDGTNTSACSNGFSYTHDNIAPNAPGTPDMTAATDTGISNTDNNTSDTTPDFMVSCTPGNTIKLYEGLNLIGTAVCGGGTITITASPAFADGSYSINATETDIAGNTSVPSAGLAIVIDTGTPNAPTITTPVTGDTVSNPTTVTGTCESGLTVHVINANFVPNPTDGPCTGGTYSIVVTWQGTTTGTQTITVNQTDLAGHTSPSATVDVIVDLTGAPSGIPDMTPATDSGVSNTDNITNISTPSFDVACQPGSTVELREGATVLATDICPVGGVVTLTPTTPLSDGPHNITSSQDNGMGFTPASLPLPIVIDTTAPAVPTITTPTNGSNVTNPTTVTGTCETGAMVNVSNANITASPVSGPCIGGLYSIPVTWINTTYGPQTISVNQVDPAGNTSPSATVDVVVTGVTASITITKVVVNDSGTGSKVVADFPLFVDAIAMTSGVANVSFVAGTYTISETNQPGYTATISGDCATNGSLTVIAGDAKTCTITNDDNAIIVPPPTQAHLIITKVVVNDNGGSKVVADFPLFVDSTSVTSGASNTFNPGTYTVSETNQAGYVGVITGDCAADGTITLIAGDNKECTITNNDVQAKLTVTKVVVNNNGGTKVVADFPLFVNTTSVTSGTQASFDAGTYTVSETNQAGYSGVISGDCALNGSITLAVGDVKTCTITNDDVAAPVVTPPSGGGGGGGLLIVSGCRDNTALNYNYQANSDTTPTSCVYSTPTPTPVPTPTPTPTTPTNNGGGIVIMPNPASPVIDEPTTQTPEEVVIAKTPENQLAAISGAPGYQMVLYWFYFNWWWLLLLLLVLLYLYWRYRTQNKDQDNQ